MSFYSLQPSLKHFCFPFCLVLSSDRGSMSCLCRMLRPNKDGGEEYIRSNNAATQAKQKPRGRFRWTGADVSGQRLELFLSREATPGEGTPPP